MEIQGPGKVPDIPKIVPSEKPVDASKQAQATQSPKEDTVLISEVSKLLNKVASLPATRAQKVAQIKAQVDKGEYLTDEKLSVTIDRILKELGGK